MAKVSTATVRFVLKMNRENKNHEHPIYIVVCFNGRIEKSTGISILSRYWDKRSETIKRSCPNAPVLNKMLNDIKSKVLERRNHFEYNDIAYTPSMLLEDDNVIDGGLKASSSFKDIMNTLLGERRLKHTTCKRYRHAFMQLSSFVGNENFGMGIINYGFLVDFAKWMKLCDGSKRSVFGCIASVYRYAISKRIVDGSSSPFIQFKVNKFKTKEREYFLDELHIRMLMDYFLDMVVIRNGKRWSYKDGAFERLHKRTSKEFAVLWFLLMYKMNGSAPTDVAKLRVDECKRIRIGNDDYWALDFKRKKTDSGVHVRWKRDMFCIIALEHFMGCSTNGLVYPIITHAEGSDEQRTYAVNYAGRTALTKLREVFAEINDVIINSNAVNDKNDPLIDLDEVCLYTARHSFANHYINSPNATIGGLASLLARSPNTISCYIHQITHNDEIASMVEDMPI